MYPQQMILLLRLQRQGLYIAGGDSFEFSFFFFSFQQFFLFSDLLTPIPSFLKTTTPCGLEIKKQRQKRGWGRT